MLDQISQVNFLPLEVQQFPKTWTQTAQYAAKFMNPNDHSEPTLTEICDVQSETSKSQRFLTNKSLERKHKNMKGIFKKPSEKALKNNISDKVVKNSEK